MKTFFDAIPKTPSHYCRRDTKKIHLDIVIDTKTKLYDIYKKRCNVFQDTPFPMCLLSNYFREQNYSLFNHGLLEYPDGKLPFRAKTLLGPTIDVLYIPR